MSIGAIDTLALLGLPGRRRSGEQLVFAGVVLTVLVVLVLKKVVR